MQFLKRYLKISKHTIEKILYLLTNRHPSLELTHSCSISTLVHFLQKQDRFIVIIVFLLSVDSTTWNFMGPFIVSKPSLAVGHGICFTTWKNRFVISSIRFFSLVVECLVSCSSQNLLISSAHWMFLFGLRAYSTILLFTTPLSPSDSPFPCSDPKKHPFIKHPSSSEASAKSWSAYTNLYCDPAPSHHSIKHSVFIPWFSSDWEVSFWLQQLENSHDWYHLIIWLLSLWQFLLK